MTFKVYPDNMIPSMSGEDSCLKDAYKINRIHSSRSAISRMKKDLKFVTDRDSISKKIPRPQSTNVEELREYCIKMSRKFSGRSEMHYYLRDINNQKEYLSTLGKPNYKPIREALVDSKELTPEKNLFNVDIELTGSSMDSGKIILFFTIGEHIIKPVSESSRQRCPDDISREWWDQMRTCGIKRPSMNLELSIYPEEDGDLNDVKMGIRFDEYNLSQQYFMVDEYGEDYKPPKEGDEDQGIRGHAHPHMRSEGDGYLGGCMGSFTHPVSQAIASGNYTYLCELVIHYMTSFDLSDEWGNAGIKYFRQDVHLAECEPDRPIWHPEFVIDGGVIEFLNKPDGFDYQFKVYGLKYSEDGETQRELISTFDTKEKSTIDIEGYYAIKVTTDQDKSSTISFSRRR